MTLIYFLNFQVSNIPDLVLNVSPAFPPYSLLLLQRIWEKFLHIVVKTHLHSTITTLDAKADEFSRTISSEFPRNGLPELKILLIWKDGNII